MKKSAYIFMFAALTAAFAACSNDPVEDLAAPAARKTITVSLDAELTRTVLTDDHQGLKWVAGDKFGYFSDVVGDTANTALEYTEGATTYELNVAAAATELYAYYPWNESNTSTTVALNLGDQTQSAAGVFHGADFPMAAKAEIVGTTAALKFKPVACALAFNVYNTAGTTDEKVLQIAISGTDIGGTGTYDLTTGTYEPTAAADGLKVTLTEPAAVGASKPEVAETAAGQIYLMLAKGNYTDVKITVATTASTYEFTGAKFDFTSSNMIPVNLNLSKGTSYYRVGDKTADNKGMIFWVDPNNPKAAKAVSLTRFGGKPFEADVKLHNAFSTDNGMDNTALYIDAGENDAAARAKSIGEGWYLPARTELKELFAIYNGAGEGDKGFTDASPNAISDAEKAARKKFEDMLEALGGEKINAAADDASGNSYWSSTETSTGTNAHWVRFGKWAINNGAKTSTARFVRGMCCIGEYKLPAGSALINVDPNPIVLSYEANATVEATVATNKATYDVSYEEEWLSVTKADNKLTIKALSENATGAVRSASVTLTAGSGTGGSVTLTITQNPKPDASKYNIGDYVEVGGQGGVVYWVDPANEKNAMILAINIHGPMNFVDSTLKETELGLTDKEDGSKNLEKMATYTTTQIPILAHCVNGWYIPADNEMLALYNAYTANEDVIDTALTTNGGVVFFSSSETYFTSTEYSASRVGFIRTSGSQVGTIGDAAKVANKPSRYFRLIRKVSKE